VIVIAESDEAKRLQGSIVSGANRAQHFSHASHRATLDLERYLDEVTLAQRSA
jgi:hypothetical protein